MALLPDRARRATRSHRRTRLLALAGAVGPATFVASWARLGTRTAGYSPVENHISDLAAIGAPTRGAMSAAFVADGVGIIGFGLALRETLEGPAWIAAVVTGVSTLAVAATPLGGRTGDGAHAASAAVGYAATSVLPLLASRPLARAGHPTWARVSFATGTASAACLVASTFGPAHGLWQRLGLTIGDAWIIASALLLPGQLTGQITAQQAGRRSGA